MLQRDAIAFVKAAGQAAEDFKAAGRSYGDKCDKMSCVECVYEKYHQAKFSKSMTVFPRAHRAHEKGYVTKCETYRHTCM